MKTVVVPTTPERAFEVFTAEMSAWWPLAGFSIGEDKAREVRFEGAVGGTEVELTHTGWERRRDGSEVHKSYDSGWDHVLDLYAAHNR